MSHGYKEGNPGSVQEAFKELVNSPLYKHLTGDIYSYKKTFHAKPIVWDSKNKVFINMSPDEYLSKIKSPI